MTPESKLADVRLGPPWLCSQLWKQKSQRRFFRLRSGLPHFECYQNVSFCAGGAPPKLSVNLVGACTISKHVDVPQGQMIILYTRDHSLSGRGGDQRGIAAGVVQRPPAGACPTPPMRPKSRVGREGIGARVEWLWVWSIRNLSLPQVTEIKLKH